MELSGNVNNLSDEGAVRYLHAQEAIRKARAKRRWITAGIIVASLFVLMVGCGIAVGAAASGDGTAHASAATPTASAAHSAPVDPGLREETRVVPVPPAATTAPAIEAPAPVTGTAPVGPYPPAAAFDEGMWTVGADAEIAPGTYRSRGPADDVIKMCYIDAKVGDHYAVQEISDAGPVRVTLAEGQTVSTNGCQQFTKVD